MSYLFFILAVARRLSPFKIQAISTLVVLSLSGCAGHVPLEKGDGAHTSSSERVRNGAESAHIVPNVITAEPDGYPEDRDVSHIPNATVRYEPRTQAGNRSPYKVAGKTYRVISDPRSYQKRGKASWYGTKFQGRRTANGERYDMFKMTAASPELPIPSYVRVTNLQNSLEVVVRVNDRGPFKSGRIIDLSYAAAKKLGFHAQGTADVEVEYLDNQTPAMKAQIAKQPLSNSSAVHELPMGFSPGRTWFQVGAFSSLQNADKVIDMLERYTELPITLFTPELDAAQLFKVRVGPLQNRQQAQDLYKQIIDLNYGRPKLLNSLLED